MVNLLESLKKEYLKSLPLTSFLLEPALLSTDSELKNILKIVWHDTN